MKKVNIQSVYVIPGIYPWIAMNQTGILNGFLNPPIRDRKTGEWQDSVTGDYGFFIPFDKWENMVREVKDMSDISLRDPHKKRRENQWKNLQPVKSSAP
jgi:hypothetical protein